MSVSSQDLVKGVDFTGLTTANASDYNQLVDTGTVGVDRGLIIESTDTALNVPVVPDANATTKFKRYLWKRNFYSPSAAPALYFWQDGGVNDNTLLKWKLVNQDYNSLSGIYFKNTINELRALQSSSINKVGIVVGSVSAFDIRPRLYVWNPTLSLADDGGSVIRSTDGLLGGWQQVF